MAKNNDGNFDNEKSFHSFVPVFMKLWKYVNE